MAGDLGQRHWSHLGCVIAATARGAEVIPFGGPISTSFTTDMALEMARCMAQAEHNKTKHVDRFSICKEEKWVSRHGARRRTRGPSRPLLTSSV